MNYHQHLWGNILRKYERGIKSLFRSTTLTVEGLNNLVSSHIFKKESWIVTANTVKDIVHYNTKHFKDLLKQTSKERQLREILNKKATKEEIEYILTVQSNNRIKTLPLDISRHITECVTNAYLNGKSIVNVPEIALNKVQLIARSELAKLATEVTHKRSTQLGLKLYRWQSQLDQVTRPSHRLMHGVLINWSDPPDPQLLNNEKSEGFYHAGCTWNCRCISDPVIDLSKVFYPVRLYNSGKIKMVGRLELEKIISA